MNPGGSVKDRAGRQMILEAEKRGELRPGGLVVEATAGNTGIGLALVANARGYRTVIVIPQTQSEEKKDMLRLFGAELVEVPAAAVQQSEQLSARRPPPRRTTEEDREERRHLRRPVEQSRQPQGALRLDRCRKSGSDTDGKIDGFICAVGTGGTLAGVSQLSAREEKGHRHRRRRSARRRDVQSVRARRGESERRRLDHRRHRARPRDADHQGHEGRQGLSHSRRGSRADHLRSSSSTKASASAAPPASTSRAPSGSRRISAPATPS